MCWRPLEVSWVDRVTNKELLKSYQHVNEKKTIWSIIRTRDRMTGDIHNRLPVEWWKWRKLEVDQDWRDNGSRNIKDLAQDGDCMLYVKPQQINGKNASFIDYISSYINISMSSCFFLLLEGCKQNTIFIIVDCCMRSSNSKFCFDKKSTTYLKIFLLYALLQCFVRSPLWSVTQSYFHVIWFGFLFWPT